MATPKPLRVLSLDGGGVRGLSSLLILQQLLRAAFPDPPPKPCEVFDLIGGTSTGGLIALMLGRLEMDIQDCISIYLRLSETVFQPRRRKSDWLGRISDAVKVRGKFDSEALRVAIQDISERATGDCEALLKDKENPHPKCRVFVCATRSELGTKTAILRSYSSKAPSEVDCKIWEAGRATSAASTFFDPIKIGEFGEQFVDGATGCNNPVERVLEEARSLWPDFDERCEAIISIGTGRPTLGAFGSSIPQVAKTLVAISTETEETAERFQSMHQRFCVVGQRRTTKAYYRFNVVRGLENVGLEEYKESAKIAAATRVYLATKDVSVDVQACATSLNGKDIVSTEVQESEDHFQRHNSTETLSDQCIKALESLSSMNVQQHLYDTVDRETRTFEWTLNHTGYRESITHELSGAWYITGKPGSGKSVLSKFLFTRLGARRTNETIAFFAFNARVEKRSRLSNIIASLIAQILQKCNLPLPEELLDRYRHLVAQKLPIAIWSTQELLRILYSLLMDSYPDFRLRAPVVIIIDGLDECVVKAERAEFVSFMDRIISSQTAARNCVRFILTSRPYTELSFQTKNLIKLDLNLEAEMDHDLLTYTKFRVFDLIQRRPHFQPYRTEIIHRIASRAEKMYLIVKLLVDMLQGSARSSPHAITELLNSLPTTLSEIYDQIWLQTVEGEDATRAHTFFSWILCAFTPLTLIEFSRFVAIYDRNAAFKAHLLSQGKTGNSEQDQETSPQEPSVKYGPGSLFQHVNNSASSGKEKEEPEQPQFISLGWAVEDFLPLDIEGDLQRLLGPLIQIQDPWDQDFDEDELLAISDSIQNIQQVNENRRGNSLVALCHQSVKDHFRQKRYFMSASEVHAQIAGICVRNLDGTIEDDPDTCSLKSFDSDSVNLTVIESFQEGGFGTTYAAAYWIRHRDYVIRTKPQLAGAISFRKTRRSSGDVLAWME